MTRRRMWLTGAVTASLVVAGGVAVNQVLDNGEWSWPWLLGALTITLVATLIGAPRQAAGQERNDEPSGRTAAASLSSRVTSALVGLLVLLASVGVLVVHLFGPKGVEEWDDTLYPQEIESAPFPAEGELLDLILRRPRPLWTVTVSGAPSMIAGGDASTVVLGNRTHLFGLDRQTGKQRWIVGLHEPVTSCAVRYDRIACLARTGMDTALFFLDARSGRTVKTVKVPNRELDGVVLVDDRFVAMTAWSVGERGFAAGYTTEGDQLWTREGGRGMYLAAGRGVVVDPTDEDTVVFVDAADGRELVRSARPRGVRKRDLAWHVFRGGIAVQNADWTGTDIYGLDGRKKSSVAGWEPAGAFDPDGGTSPVPLVARLGDREPYRPGRHTIAAANPRTGHLLWRISGPELTMRMAGAGNKLVISVADPDAPLDAWGEPRHTPRTFVRVYDCATGRPVSPPIDVAGDSSIEPYGMRSDGHSLVYHHGDDRPDELGQVAVGFDIATGERLWQLPLAGWPRYVDGVLVAATGPDAVSLFG